MRGENAPLQLDIISLKNVRKKNTRQTITNIFHMSIPLPFAVCAQDSKSFESL